MNATSDPTTGEALSITAAEFDIRVHNAIITCHNPATGDHRTFAIRTVSRETNWGTRARPYYPEVGTRYVEILTGGDRSEGGDWKRFGFVGHTGVISVFRNMRGENGQRSDWEKFAVILAAPDRFPRLEWELLAYCRRCNRPLTNWDSLMDGRGPVCRESAD